MMIFGIIFVSAYITWVVMSTIYWICEDLLECALEDSLYKDYDWQILDAAEDMNKRGKKLTLIFSIAAFPIIYAIIAIYRFCHDLED